MSTKDDALIEKMAGEYGRANPFLTNPDHYPALRAALAVARKAILEEAAKVAEGVFYGTSNLGTPQKNEFYGGGELWHSGSMYDEARIDAAEAIRSLATQEQHND